MSSKANFSQARRDAIRCYCTRANTTVIQTTGHVRTIMEHKKEIKLKEKEHVASLDLEEGTHMALVRIRMADRTSHMRQALSSKFYHTCGSFDKI